MQTWDILVLQENIFTLIPATSHSVSKKHISQENKCKEHSTNANPALKPKVSQVLKACAYKKKWSASKSHPDSSDAKWKVSVYVLA